MKKFIDDLIKSFLGGISFYTIVPLPREWELNFERIARWAPLIGILLGCFLSLIDLSLFYLGIPILTRSALIIGLWVVLTGGLHLDGVIDTGDGLGVGDPQKRLEVMKDSTTGAFGVIAGVVLLLLKISALSDIAVDRGFALITAASWGRWGQVVAIAAYPYLRATGKGFFHKEFFQVPADVILGLILIANVNLIWLLNDLSRWGLWVIIGLFGITSALITGAWFNKQLGGHTGDSYGAVVEWTEAIYLCILTAIIN